MPKVIAPAPKAGGSPEQGASGETGFRTSEFGQLPVLMNGRFQPFDSVARNSLLQIRQRQSVVWKEDGKYRTLSARDWLIEVMMKPEQADDRKIFRIDNVELISLLKLTEEQKYYTFNELKPQYDEIGKQAERIERTGPPTAVRSSDNS